MSKPPSLACNACETLEFLSFSFYNVLYTSVMSCTVISPPFASPTSLPLTYRFLFGCTHHFRSIGGALVFSIFFWPFLRWLLQVDLRSVHISLSLLIFCPFYFLLAAGCVSSYFTGHFDISTYPLPPLFLVYPTDNFVPQKRTSMWFTTVHKAFSKIAFWFIRFAYIITLFVGRDLCRIFL